MSNKWNLNLEVVYHLQPWQWHSIELWMFPQRKVINYFYRHMLAINKKDDSTWKIAEFTKMMIEHGKRMSQNKCMKKKTVGINYVENGMHIYKLLLIFNVIFAMHMAFFHHCQTLFNFQTKGSNDETNKSFCHCEEHSK